ncbi:MAG: hypothetical protein PHI02_06265 [Sulfurovaceae bacterium]|nr:hypothetical protein [Sulfurovaceae bacterium]
MVRIEGTNRVGEKIWLETNCLLTARAFIDELITYEYKDANISAIRKELKEYESMEGYIGDKVDLQAKMDLQEEIDKAGKIVGVKLPDPGIGVMAENGRGERAYITPDGKATLEKISLNEKPLIDLRETYQDFMAQHVNDDAVEDNFLGGVGYIRVIVPRGVS